MPDRVAATTAPTDKRMTKRKEGITTFDKWIIERHMTSSQMQAMLAGEATREGIDQSYVPSTFSVMEFRVGRSFPTVVAAFLILKATRKEIGPEEWARDVLRLGHRKRPPKTRRNRTP